MTRLPGLALLLLAVACGGADARPAALASTSPATTTTTTASATTTTTYFRHAGFLWNRAVERLPVAARRDGFLFGTIEDAATWSAFAGAAELREVPAIDFGRQMVVFAVLDARTNALSPATWKLDGAGRAVFSFEHAGAEPYNPDAAPGTLAVVDRAGVKSIAFRTLAGEHLGTVTR